MRAVHAIVIVSLLGTTLAACSKKSVRHIDAGMDAHVTLTDDDLGELPAAAGHVTGPNVEGWSVTGGSSVSGGTSTDDATGTVHQGGFVPGLSE